MGESLEEIKRFLKEEGASGAEDFSIGEGSWSSDLLEAPCYGVLKIQVYRFFSDQNLILDNIDIQLDTRPGA